MKPLFRIFFLFLTIILTLPTLALAQAVATPDVSILNTVTHAMSVAATNQIGPMALGWFGALVSLQFVVTNFQSLKSGGDITDVFAKFIGLLFSVGISLLLITKGPDFIDSVGHGVFGKFLGNVPGAGAIITATLGICSTLVVAVIAIGLVNTAVAMLLVNVILVVFGVGMYMATKVFMLYLELGMVVLLSPLSFSLLGLGALREQGIAPLKSLISLIYRAVVLGIIYSAFGEVVNVAGASLKSINWINPLEWPAAVNTILAMLCAYPVIAYLAYKSDSMASSLAGGSTNMGAGDVASAAAAGAAAGAAVMTGSASAANAIAQAPSMADFMKSTAGSISNASSMGMGSTPVGLAPKSSPSMSTVGSGGSGASAPGSAHSKGIGPPPSNDTPRSSAGSRGGAPGGSAASTSQTGQNAFDGVAAAGGSEAAATAAAEAASGGGSNEAVSAAVVNAGGTVEHGAAAATAMAIGEAGGSPSAIKAGAQAAGAGKSSAEVGEAVSNTLVPGTAMGHPRNVAAAATSASRTRPKQSAIPGSGGSSSIQGAGTSADQKHDALMEAIKQQGQGKQPTAFEHLKDLNKHVSQEKAATVISINSNHHD